MVDEEITDPNRIATLLRSELTNRTTGGFERLTVEDTDTGTIIRDTETDDRLGRYRPADTADGLTITLLATADAAAEEVHIRRAADIKTVADRLVERIH